MPMQKYHPKSVTEVLLVLAFWLILIAATWSLSGCASVHKQLDSLPAGSADEVTYTRTGKFSSTTIHVEKWEKDAVQAKADVITVQHSNAWIPNLTLTAKGYRRVREPKAAAPATEAPQKP